MGLILINLQSNDEIRLEENKPFIIGRTNITGCTDKRVSRSHCRITSTKGKIILLALHTNPCFYTRRGTPPVVQLNKDEEEVLSVGDTLGLLPNMFWYKITSKPKSNERLKNSESGPSSINLPKTKLIPKVEVVNVEETNQTSSHNVDLNSTPNTNLYLDLNIRLPPEGYSPSLEGTCRLPVWMYEIKGQNNLSENEGTPDPTHSAGLGLNQRADLPSNSSSAPTEARIGENGAVFLADGSILKPGRPYCHYDSSCYRKNPQHKVDFSHPGDDDYVSFRDRPMCQYGVDCYRRNPAHRRQFRHVGLERHEYFEILERSNASRSSTAATCTTTTTIDTATTATATVITATPTVTTAATTATVTTAATTPTVITAAGPATVITATTPATVITATNTATVITATTTATVITATTTATTSTTAAGTGASTSTNTFDTGAGTSTGTATASTSFGSLRSGSAVNGIRATINRKRLDEDPSLTSCRLSVTVSTSPEQKRRRDSDTEGPSYLTSDFTFDDEDVSSSDQYSDDDLYDEFFPSDDSFELEYDENVN